MCQRLGKQRNENKFSYLFEAYERIDNHVVTKRKADPEKIQEMKNITARYFVTCLTCPDMFELTNESTVVIDNPDQSMNFLNDESHTMN